MDFVLKSTRPADFGLFDMTMQHKGQSSDMSPNMFVLQISVFSSVRISDVGKHDASANTNNIQVRQNWVGESDIHM